MMPNMDGMEVCNTLRKESQFKDTLIVFLTARGENYSQLAGFEVGADDYITKPITPRLLVARVKALLKRAGSDEEEAILHVGPLLIDREKMLVYKDDQLIPLPKMEFNLLNLLASKPGRVFPRKEIYQSLWGNDLMVSDRTMDVHIRKLREKIGEDCIKTVIGVGYKFNEELA
jgi:two-component system alkaline phosphatase synthesis response regulator PhoP